MSDEDDRGVSSASESGEDTFDDDVPKGPTKQSKTARRVKSIYNVVSGQKNKARAQQVEEAQSSVLGTKAHSTMHIDKKGWIWKKGDSRSNWRRRYFLLSGPFLSYYHDEHAASKASFDSYDGALGVIPLRGVKVERFFHRQRANCFKLVHSGRRTYFLDCDSEDEKFEWLDAISLASDMGVKQEHVARFYTELGLDHSVEWSRVKRAYRKLALRNHPDKGGDVQRFQLITEAYEVLSSLQAEQEEKEAEAETTDTVVVESTVQKGPPGVGLGLHLGSKFVGVHRDEIIVVLGVLGLAEAKGELMEGDRVTAIDNHSTLTLVFNDVVAMLQSVEVGADVKVTVERKIAKSGLQAHLSEAYGLSPDARARSTSLQQAEATQARNARGGRASLEYRRQPSKQPSMGTVNEAEGEGAEEGGEAEAEDEEDEEEVVEVTRPSMSEVDASTEEGRERQRTLHDAALKQEMAEMMREAEEEEAEDEAVGALVDQTDEDIKKLSSAEMRRQHHQMREHLKRDRASKHRAEDRLEDLELEKLETGRVVREEMRELESLKQTVKLLLAERDEARAEVERLRRLVPPSEQVWGGSKGGAGSHTGGSAHANARRGSNLQSAGSRDTVAGKAQTAFGSTVKPIQHPGNRRTMQPGDYHAGGYAGSHGVAGTGMSATARRSEYSKQHSAKLARRSMAAQAKGSGNSRTAQGKGNSRAATDQMYASFTHQQMKEAQSRAEEEQAEAMRVAAADMDDVQRMLQLLFVKACDDANEAAGLAVNGSIGGIGGGGGGGG